MAEEQRFSVDELAKMAGLAIDTERVAPGGWYSVGSPWLPHDCETYIIAGSHDPHGGVPVCDFSDAAMAGVEDRFEDHEWSARNDQIARFIETFDPPTVRALLRQCKLLQLAADNRVRQLVTYGN